MFSLICRLFRGEHNVVGLGSHDKGRAHMGDIGIGRKPIT
jgi:hypothetical protein